MIDFSGECEQFVQGPVPDGSCVFVKISELLMVNNDVVLTSKNGLLMIRPKFTVSRGTYNGYSFSDYIMLPLSQQVMQSMTNGQEYSCRLGGARIRAILEYARRPLQIQSYNALIGLEFIARLRVQEYMNSNNEWRQANRLDRVLVEQDNEFADVKKYGELLTEVEEDMPQPQPTQPVQSTQESAYVQPSEQVPTYQPSQAQQQSAQQSAQQPMQQPQQQSAQLPQRQPQPQRQSQPQPQNQMLDQVPF